MPRNWHVRFCRQVGQATGRLSSTQLRKHWAYEEATDLIIANVRAGECSTDSLRWLARLYRAQGDENLAMQAAAEAAKYLPPLQQLVPDSADRAAAALEESERRAILDAEVERFVASGYRLIARTATTAQLIRPKRFSALLSILSLLLCLVGFLIYLLLYWSDKDETAYLIVDETGVLHGQFDPPRPVRRTGGSAKSAAVRIIHRAVFASLVEPLGHLMTRRRVLLHIWSGECLER